MIPLKLSPMHYSDIGDLLQYILETTDENSAQYKAALPIIEEIKENTKTLSRKRRMSILCEDLKKSDLFHQRISDIGGLL